MTLLKITVCCVIHTGSQPNHLISFAVTSPQLVADVNVSLVGTITGLSNLRKTQPKKIDFSEIQYLLLKESFTPVFHFYYHQRMAVQLNRVTWCDHMELLMTLL